MLEYNEKFVKLVNSGEIKQLFQLTYDGLTSGLFVWLFGHAIFGNFQIDELTKQIVFERWTYLPELFTGLAVLASGIHLYKNISNQTKVYQKFQKRISKAISSNSKDYWAVISLDQNLGENTLYDAPKMGRDDDKSDASWVRWELSAQRKWFSNPNKRQETRRFRQYMVFYFDSDGAPHLSTFNLIGDEKTRIGEEKTNLIETRKTGS